MLITFIMGDLIMNKRIIAAVLISMSISLLGCGNDQAKTQAASSASAVSSKDSSSEKQQISSSQTSGVSEVNYSNYSGNWVTERNLKEDFKYGIVVSINADKDGNLKGQISDSTENLTHISNVDIRGQIQDNKFIYNFSNDGWDHNGTIRMDFKENNIVLTIKYNAGSSENNSWGIGEGTFTLISENTKINRTLNDLKDGGLQVIENQCFPISLNSYGRVRFISGSKREDCTTIVNFYLLDDENNVLYKLPSFYGNEKGMFNNILAVSFKDVNNDGLKDIIIIADYKTNAAASSPICSIYFGKGREFINDKSLDSKINSSSNNKDISSALKYARENLKK